MSGSKIVDIAYYLPKKEVVSETLLKEFKDFDTDKVENKIGIKKRHVSNQNETSLELGFEASKKLLEANPDCNIDFIVFCTQTPKFILPTSACILQNMLGLPKNIGALDFNLGCSGYVYGLAVCKGIIAAGVAKNILFVTSDTYTKYIHQKDKGNRSIFGDGATATLVSECSDMKIGEFVLGTDGSGYDKLIIRNGGAGNKYDTSANEKIYGDQNVYDDNSIYMNGPEIFNFTINNIPSLIQKTIDKNNLLEEKIDYYIFHQANKFMLEYLRKKMKLGAEKFFIDLEQSGNTVSSTIPIALKQAIAKGDIKKGDKVLIAGFGVGLSWGATVITI
ncbi:ketoacyl-ACP synthase III [Flagellimonas baculiformis]|uniref:ketoacyl-ACP synthase III n=1 Tax=Flagellimonas baculiformis TaxID=3067310 RepID=UPI00296E90C5|nr:ketoacyl-ACP synthase III [Muricauda sp. D6]